MLKTQWTHWIAAACALLAAPALVGQPRRASGSEMSAKLVHKVRPAYPAEAKAKGIEGTVKLQVTINTKGEITQVEVLSGPEELRASTVEAVRQWRYQSLEHEVVCDINVNFVLPRKAKAEEPR